MASLLALLPAAGHDQMWLLYAARLVLHGAPLYGPQVFETNPPLIVWLSMVPAALSGVTRIPDTALGKFFLIALEAGIATLCLGLLRRMRPALSRAALYWLGFVYIVLFAVAPARDFGQRDHLLILFILPYIFAAAARAEGRTIPAREAWLIGILGLAGVVLKPHQILIPIAVESLLLAWRRTRTHREPGLLRPEIYAMLLAGVAFVAAIRLFAPFYFTVILPVVGDTYWAYHQLSLGELLAQSIQLHILAAIDLGMLLWIGWRKTPALTATLLAAGAASTVAFYIQGTGWYYQQLPALSLFGLALGFLLLDLASQTRLTLPRRSPAAAAALGVLALGLTAHFMGYPFTAERSFPMDTPDPSFFSSLAPGTPVMTLSPTIDYTIQPLYKYRLTLGERYPAFLMLPALLRSEDPQGKPLSRHLTAARLAELDAMQRRFLLEDLDRWKPQLLLVERCQDPAVHCQVLEDRHDDLLAWFLRDAAFRAEFASYRYWKTAGSFDGYLRK